MLSLTASNSGAGARGIPHVYWCRDGVEDEPTPKRPTGWSSLMAKRSGAARRKGRKDKLLMLKLTGANVRSCVVRDRTMFQMYCKTEHKALVQPTRLKDSGGIVWVDGEDGINRPIVLRRGHMRTTHGFDPIVTHAQGGGPTNKTGESAFMRRKHRLVTEWDREHTVHPKPREIARMSEAEMEEFDLIYKEP